jgi:hypothetical protein
VPPILATSTPPTGTISAAPHVAQHGPSGLRRSPGGVEVAPGRTRNVAEAVMRPGQGKEGKRSCRLWPGRLTSAITFATTTSPSQWHQFGARAGGDVRSRRAGAQGERQRRGPGAVPAPKPVEDAAQCALNAAARSSTDSRRDHRRLATGPPKDLAFPPGSRATFKHGRLERKGLTIG